MLGAIVGDVVGSVYEWNNIKTKDFPLLRDDCFFTDDTVMTCAVAEAIMNGGQKESKAQWQQRMQSLCAVISLAEMTTLRRLKDALRNTSRKSMDMTFLKRWMKFVLRIVSMKRVRIPFLRRLLHSLKVQILKMRFEMRFLLVGTAILLLQLQEVSQKQLMEFLIG